MPAYTPQNPGDYIYTNTSTNTGTVNFSNLPVLPIYSDEMILMSNRIRELEEKINDFATRFSPILAGEFMEKYKEEILTRLVKSLGADFVKKQKDNATLVKQLKKRLEELEIQSGVKEWPENRASASYTYNDIHRALSPLFQTPPTAPVERASSPIGQIPSRRR